MNQPLAHIAAPATPSVIASAIERYKADPESVFNTWFIGGEERMKAFGAIRRGVRDTVDAIASETFGNDFRGSPLEVVLMAITEQKQVFEGAAHPFYWKPKLRIPDIYESEPNKQKLGSWQSYLAMRETIIQANTTQRRHQQVIEQHREESEHTQVQHMLIRIGRALNYKVFVARNDRHRSCHGESFALLTVDTLPKFGASAEVMQTVGLIDVLWLNAEGTKIVCAFEIEKSTSIYSGMLRMKDLARSLPTSGCHFYLVAPQKRKQEVMAQMSRPALQDTTQEFPLGYIAFELLKEHCDALCRFGDDLGIMKKIADFGLNPL